MGNLMSTWCSGNAPDDADHHRSWLLGNFIASETPGAAVRNSDALEVKGYPLGRPATTRVDC